MKNWNDIKTDVYEKIENILKRHIYEKYTNEIHDKIINECKLLIQPYIGDKIIYDVRFHCNFDEKRNGIIFNFGWKIKKDDEFTLAKFEAFPVRGTFEDFD